MANIINVLNGIRATASAEYQSRIPVATQTNITTIGNSFEEYDAQKNEFLQALINKIALTAVRQKMAKNPLEILKGGYIEYGTDIEELFIEMAKSKVYDPEDMNPFAKANPDVKAMYHRVNRKDKYTVTVYDEQLRGAFKSADSLTRFVQGIINSVYSGDKYDEFVLSKEILSGEIADMATVTVDNITDTTSAKKFLKALKKVSKDFTFVSNVYNQKGVKTLCDYNEQVLIIHKDATAEIDVEVLLNAFNPDKAKANVSQVIEVDDFGTHGAGVVAMLIDKESLMIHDNLFKATQQRNESALYTNYFLHHWQLLSFSKFLNAAVFKYTVA